MSFTHGWSLFFQANKADAVTIDGALLAEAGLPHHNLKPIMAEYYGSKDGVFSLGPGVTGVTWWPRGGGGGLAGTLSTVLVTFVAKET